MQASLQTKRKQNAKLFKPPPRLASRKYVLRLNKFLEAYNDSGLVFFRNSEKLDTANLMHGCRTGKFPEPMPSLPADLVVESLAIATDQEQTQITGGEFVFSGQNHGGLGITGVRLSDPFHRWHNDLQMSLAKSGLTPCEDAGTLIFNIGYGPWQSANWFHLICAQGNQSTATLTPNSSLVLKLWPRHLVDCGDKPDDDDDAVTGESARQRYLSSIPEQCHMNLKGVKVKPSQWMSFQYAGQLWEPHLATRAMVLAMVCLNKGWLTTEEDLYASTRCGTTAYGDKPDPNSKKEAVKGAKAKLESLKQRSANTIVAATRLLNDIDVINGIRIILHCSKAEWTAFNEAIAELTTPEKSLAFCQNWSQSGWLQSLMKTMDSLSDMDGLSRCGIKNSFDASKAQGLWKEDPNVKYQDALAQRAGRFVDNIVRTRCGSLATWSFYYPHKLVGLTSDDAAISQSTLREFHADVRAFWAAQETLG